MKIQKQNFNSNRKIIIGVLVGFLTTALLYGIVAAISLYTSVAYYTNLAQSMSVEKWIQPNQTLLTLQWIFKGVFYLIFLLGGIITAKIVRKKGWLYGGIVGIIWDVLILLFIFVYITIYAFFPHIIFINYNTSYEHIKNLQLQKWIADIPSAFFNFTIPLTVLGGWIGEKLQTRRLTNK